MFRRKQRDWSSEYDAGQWDKLRDLAEVPHLGVVAGYLRRQVPTGASVLDVGCGEGLLCPLLVGHVGTYVGVDLPAVVARAPAPGTLPAGFGFVGADFDTFDPGRPFAALVFCESLYYALDADRTLARYLELLDTDGVLLVSCFVRRKHRGIWRLIDERCERLDGVRIVHPTVGAWDVAVFRRRRA